jgi:hypothetical protein
MIWLLCFALAVLASPFKSKLRLEAENAVLRHQLIVLRRQLKDTFGHQQTNGAELGDAARNSLPISSLKWLCSLSPLRS